MINTRAIGKAGELQAAKILETLGYKNITDVSSNNHYDLVAHKNGRIYHIEVKTRSRANVFHILAHNLRTLIDAGNGLLILIRGTEYKIIEAEALEHKLQKDSIMLGISFHKNYEKLHRCSRCGHKWVSNNPEWCSACGSPYWNKPYKGIKYE